MTPLDMFCLKEKEFKSNDQTTVVEKLENELASMLYDVTEINHTYCGFKPIALAMLTGKLSLVNMFLEKNRTVVNETITGFGTLLTLLFNPVYNLNLSIEKLNEFVDLLLKANLNPLKVVIISHEKAFKGNIYDYHYTLSKPEK